MRALSITLLAAVLEVGCSLAPGEPTAEEAENVLVSDDFVADPDLAAASSSALAGLTSWEPMLSPTTPVAVGAIRANGHAMTWDGRVLVQGVQVPAKLPTSLVAEVVHPIGLAVDPSTMKNGFELRMQNNGALVLLINGTLVWSSQTTADCSLGCRAQFNSDGNLVFYRREDAGLTPYFSTGPGATQLRMARVPPYVWLTGPAGGTVWPRQSAWAVRLFSPETLTARPLEDADQVGQRVHEAFSAPTVWLVPAQAEPAFYPQQHASLPLLTSLALVPRAGQAENPFRSNALGQPTALGTFLTYEVDVFTQRYPTASGGAPAQLGKLEATFIVEVPPSGPRRLHRAELTRDFTPLTTTADGGTPLYGIEPTVTFDGRLLVFQRFASGNGGQIDFSYLSPLGNPTAGWAPQQSLPAISNLPALRARYAIARRQLRDHEGNPITNLIGAYPWMSLDGSDVFFSATANDEKIRRAGTSVVGSSTRGLIRLIDGEPNTDRRTVPRLTMSSFGRMPGRWSPLEFMERKVLPLTDKRATYPMFTSNAARYFEASFEETVSDDYDAYYEMSEAIVAGDYLVTSAPDVSGKFHSARFRAGVAFPEETCAPQCVPHQPFSGKAVYFQAHGVMTAPARSATGHTLLDQATDLTVSLAVRPMGASRALPLVRKGGSFELSLGANRRLVFAVTRNSVGGPRTSSTGPFGPVLPAEAWSHVAITRQAASGEVTLFFNGVRYESTTLEADPLGVDPAADLEIGPGLSSASSEWVLAIDQVGLSGFRRPAEELARQANLVFPRQAELSQALPLGLKRKDVKQVAVLGPANAQVIDLGRRLFFDRRLSAGRDVSCASCHLPTRALTEPFSLHDDRRARFGGPARLLRNTPALLNLAFKSRFFADGRADGLDQQGREVLTTPAEMGSHLGAVVLELRAFPDLAEGFAAAFSTPGITEARVLEALTAFQLSLRSGNAPFDRYLNGDLAALSLAERRGKNLFFGKAGCAECHAGSAFTDDSFHVLPFLPESNADGVRDEGRMRVTGLESDRFKVMTPSLRNVARTSPFFHHGSAATLGAVVERYATNDGVSDREDLLLAVELSLAERADLEAFLGALSGDLPPVVAPIGSNVAPRAAEIVFPAGAFQLEAGQSIALARMKLRMTRSGVFVVLAPDDRILFAAGTAGDCASLRCRVVFQADGNLVIYRGPVPVWSSGTFMGRTKGATLRITETRPWLRISTATGSLPFVSNEADGTVVFDRPFSLAEGGFVRWKHDASDAFLELRPDGRLQITKVGLPTALWTSPGPSTSCGGACRMALQTDGNLVIYRGTQPLWATGTHAPRAEGDTLVMSRQGTPLMRLMTQAGATAFAAP